MSKVTNTKVCPKYVKNCKKFGWKYENCEDTDSNIHQNAEQNLKLSKLEKESVANLLSELSQVINDNIKLTKENALLKADHQKCNNQIFAIENTFKDEINQLTSDLQNTQKKLTITEQQLQDRENHISKENQIALNKLNDFKDLYYSERKLAMMRENTLKTEVDTLKKQLAKSKEYMEDLLTQLKNSKGKVASYKEKLKFSVNLFSEINEFLNKPRKENKFENIAHKESQTEERLLDINKKDCNCKGCSLECENIVLSELFFKETDLQTTLDDIFFGCKRKVEE